MLARTSPILLAIATALLTALISITSLAANTIGTIEVSGNQRIEASTIIAYLSLNKGDTYTEDKANESLKSLYATELFSDISISYKKPSLIVKVTENPLINKIIFEGNKRINDDTLASEIFLKPRSVYTKSKLQNDVKRLQSVYQKSGRFSASIVPKVITLDQSRINVVFEIEEGNKATIQSIRFIGNEFFTTKALREVINTSESRWYNFFSSNDTYDPDRVEFDKELLRKFYLSSGFAEFSVISAIAEITSDKRNFILTFTLNEGIRYNFGEIDINNQLPNLGLDELLGTESIETITGELFNAQYINNTVDNITNHLNERGYAFVEVRPQYKYLRDEKKINIAYRIQEGPKVYIDRINISGNVRTLDKVIRREFRINEGDPFNASKIKRSRERIQNLNFFDKVTIQNVPGIDNDRSTLNVEVEERSTGELNFGAGFSTTDGALGNVSIRERNLLGRAQDLRLSFQQSSRGSQISSGFTEPYFLGKDLSAGIDVFTVENDFSDESSFDSSTQGFTLRLGYSLTEFLRHSVRYSLQTVDITDIEADASLFIRKQEGDNSTSLVGHTLLYDRRDNKFDPTEGYYLQFNQDVAGLGGNSKYIKHEVKTGHYFPVYKRDVILSFRTKAGSIFGYGGKKVRINERYYIGGSTIRGFENAGIGPRDIATNDALGGKNYYFGSSEVSFPLGLPEELGFKGALFVDAADLFDTDDASSATIKDESSIRASVGAGVSWTSPLGPIRLDIAHPFAKEEYDRTRTIQFNFGTRF